jgi:hypothetical protein
VHSLLESDGERTGSSAVSSSSSPLPACVAVHRRSEPSDEPIAWSTQALPTTLYRKVWPSFWPCLLYGSCACALHIGNKLLLSALQFHYVFCFTALQACVVSTIVSLAWRLGLVPAPCRMTSRLFFKLGPLAVLNVANTVVGLKGLQHMKLPMYLVLRRLVAPTVVIINRFVAGQKESLPNVAALLTMTAGALVAASADLSFSVQGYCYTLLANLFTAAYTMWMNKIAKGGGTDGACTHNTQALQAMDIIFYNSILSMPLLVACSKPKLVLKLN